MLSVNISAYKGNIPRNHVLVRILLIMSFAVKLSTGYSPEVSF